MLLKIFVFLSLGACASLNKSDLVEKGDYIPSKFHVKVNEPNKALKVFPEKENGGFITTVEKGWIGLIGGQADIDSLRGVGETLESRETISISQNAKSFFYKEYADGYFPAEHEAIVLHIVTAMAYAQQGQREAALVETRKAAFYLEAQYSHDHKAFDDPSLRLWLAALWTYAGDWEHARVDLRIAARQLKNTHLANLAKRKSPPAYLLVAFTGIGPEVEWDPELKPNVAGGMQNVRFAPNSKNAIKLKVKFDQTPAPRVVNSHTSIWYERHQERNRTIENVLNDSKYMLHSAGHVTASGATYALGSTASIALMAAGVAIGVASIGAGIYSLALTHSAELGLLIGGVGFAGGTYVFNKGVDTYKASSEFSKEIFDAGADTSKYYRYVRFLPDQVVFAWDRTEFEMAFDGNPIKPFLSLKSPANEQILFAHYSGYQKPIADLYWQQPDSSHQWVHLANDKSAKEAHKLCADLSKSTNHDWYLPKWEDLSRAIKSGLLDFLRNPYFADDLRQQDKIWTDYYSASSQCRAYDIQSGAEHLKVDCDRRNAVVCFKNR